jgi:hypothetical protein
MALGLPDRREDRAHPLVADTHPRQEDVHPRIIRNQEPFPVERQVDVTIARLERHAQGLLARRRRDREARLRRALDDHEPISADV